ncbi:MAG TPA: glycosyltransferase, partial [Ktedonobacteraceae bacterium]|nr:glycosyltransferase [Ktedonobacteraceae bacterium]
MQQTKIASINVQTTLSTPEISEQIVALSIVVPVMNEQESVRPLFEKLAAQLDTLGECYEVIFVDDGSTDNTFKELKILHDEHPGIVRVIRFRKNFGKTPALVAGFSRCRGEVIFTMDGDLQDDP